MGAPFDTGTWTGVTAEYFTGAGGAMPTIWLFVSIALCVLALFVGGKHEQESYEKSEK